MTDSAQPTVFQPHHRTTIIYPSFAILEDVHLSPNQAVLLPVADSENRYEPGPLVEDEAVAIHSSRESHAESSITIITPATGRHPLDVIEQRTDQPTGLRWIQEMRYVQQYPGETVLNAVTYRGDYDTVDMIMIVRWTSLRDQGSRRLKGMHVVTYNMPVHLFERVDAAAPVPDLWVAELRDLLRRRSDRAVLHVRHQLQHHQYDDMEIADVETVWKAKRCPPYQSREREVVSGTVQDLTSLAPELTECHTCRNAFEHPNHTPLVLACCSKLICRYCYVSWCESVGPDKAACPHCRHPFFQNSEQLNFLKFGTVGRAYATLLIPNQSYNAWESLERMSADLDKELAENNQSTVRADVPLLLRAWQHLVNGALLEPASSTPLHLQPVRCAEFSVITAALPSILAEYSGVQFPTDILYHNMQPDFLICLFRRFLKGGAHEYLTHGEFASLSQQPSAEGMGLPPGLEEFVERTLSRTLQFLHLRLCEDCASGVGWHRHCDKQYYNSRI
ncbi:hypothetical protein LTR85_003477 [Meristemomyces frigidus]|nr:hypothetical protein LTR85_003477 [Meristemomyces frigidus]